VAVSAGRYRHIGAGEPAQLAALNEFIELVDPIILAAMLVKPLYLLAGVGRLCVRSALLRFVRRTLATGGASANDVEAHHSEVYGAWDRHAFHP
jgi:hypothetical protein